MFYNLMFALSKNFGRAPCAYASGSGYTLQVLTGYACCGLSAAIPHADRCAKHIKKRSVFNPLTWGRVGG
jgi:hypothetical protein